MTLSPLRLGMRASYTDKKTFATLGFQILTPNILVQFFSQERENKYWTNSKYLYVYLCAFLPIDLKTQKEFFAHIQLVLLGKWGLLADIMLV